MHSRAQLHILKKWCVQSWTVIYLENKGDCWGEEDADITSGFANEMAKFVYEQHGYMGLPASRA